MVSSGILQMAFIWHITFLTNSAATLSIASIVAFLPQALLGPFIGVWIDRMNRKFIMIASDLFIAVVAAALAIWGLFADIPVAAIMTVLALRSIGTAFHTPSLSAVTPLLVPEDQLTRYAGFSQSLGSISLIISPVLAAALYAGWSLSQIILLDVVGAVLASITVAITPIPELQAPTHAAADANASFFAEFVQGFRALQQQRGLFLLTIVGMVFMAIYMPINALFPLMSLDYFGGSTWHASFVESLFAAGMLVGGLLLGITGGFKDRVLTLFLSILLLGAALTASGLLPPSGYIGFALCCGLMGLSVPLYGGTSTALYQEKIAPQYLGRVFSLTASLSTLAMPVGLIFSALFADSMGVNHWFLLSGVLIVLLSFSCLLLPSIRKLDQPQQNIAIESNPKE